MPTRFTVVTPSFNQAAYVSQTIESVLSQEGDFEIEYFVMDGGSTDGSAEIIREYAENVKANRWPAQCAGISMEWVSQKDRGQSDAINQGLRRATGQIASYINSDDLYFEGAFARVARAFEALPRADFVYGDGDVIDDQGRLQWEWLSRPYNHKVMTSYHFLWNDFTNYIMQQATFWRAQVHSRIGLFDESFHLAMDAEYWIRAAHHGLQFRLLPEKLGKFRMIQGTKSRSAPDVFWPDYMEIFRRYCKRNRMSLFFAYYFFNVAKHSDFDLDKALKSGDALFERWRDIEREERSFLRCRAERGFAAACFMVASELERVGQADKAEAAFARGVSRARLGRRHPLALWYLLRRHTSRKFKAGADALAEALISSYRNWRYDYRYNRGTAQWRRSLNP